MKRFLASIAILLASVLVISAQQLYFPTNTDIQQKGDYNSVYKSETTNDYPMGCMATAMTIVMDYHKSPVRYDYGTVTGTNGLAKLMYDAAQSINTQYGETESSAALSEVAVQLVNTFGFDKNSVRYYLKASSGMTDEEWVALIVRNINNGMPVIYSAGTEPGVTNESTDNSEITNVSVRHAYIIDGIQRDVSAPYGYKFHINGGQGKNITDNSQWIDNIFSVTIGSMTYSDTPEMVCGIRTEEQARADVSSLKLISNEGSRGLSMSVSTIVSGQTFDVTVASLQNWDLDGNTFSGYIFPVLVRTDNNGQIVITQPDNTLEIAKQYKSTDGFSYRRILNSLTISGVKFTASSNIDMSNYSLRLATADNLNIGERALNIKLVEALAGESTDLITSVPAVSTGTVNVKFEVAQTGGVDLLQRVITNTSLTYESINGKELKLAYGTPFLFFAKRTSSAVSDNEVILTVNGKKYLMKDYFASKNFANLFDGAFYITPTEAMTIQAQLIDRTKLEKVEADLTGKAGYLSDVVNNKGVNPCNIGWFIVTGDMNADDFYYIRDNMPMLETLDLSSVNIVANGSHPANTIPEAAFYKEIYNSDGYTLALKTVYLPNSCTTIGSNAFMYCSKLEEVHIPKNVSNINYNVFFSCRNLKDIYVYNPVPYFVNWCVFKNINGNSTLHVPHGSKSLYVGDENANKLPGANYSINEWYKRWHDGSSLGCCIEMANETEGQMKVQLMRTSFVAFRDGGMKPGSAVWSSDKYEVLPTISSPVSYAMWKLRALVSYAEDGQNKEEYVYGTANNADYTFDLTQKLNELKTNGINDVNIKIDIYLNVTEAVEERAKKGQNYFYPYIYDGMEVTLTGGWTKSDSDDKLDLDNFYFGLRSGYATNLPKAKAIITLDNARIGSIQTGTVDMDIVLKNNNEMAGLYLYHSKFESFLIDNGHTVSLQGNGTLTLANDSYDGKCGPRAYSTAGGVLNLQHGITVNNLENMTFENIKVTYTRTFNRVIKNSTGTSGYGWETLALPFNVLRIENANGRQMSWATSTKTGEFWLGEMTDNAQQLTFSPNVESIEAGHSYIISVPDEGKNSLIGIPLTFVGPTLVNGDKLVDKGDFVTPKYNNGGLNVDMTPYPYTLELPSTYYVMNRDGGSFYKWDTSSTEDANLVTLRQFEAYFEPKDIASTMFKSFSLKGDAVKDETTGIDNVTNGKNDGYTVYSANGSIVVESDAARKINISTVDGRSCSYSVSQGTTRISMPAGVYIVGGNKVLVK